MIGICHIMVSQVHKVLEHCQVNYHTSFHFKVDFVDFYGVCDERSEKEVRVRVVRVIKEHET